jgi:hypothetical protein
MMCASTLLPLLAQSSASVARLDCVAALSAALDLRGVADDAEVASFLARGTCPSM